MNDMMLIVDDVEMNREVLKVIFNKKYEILEAENGEEALNMIRACQGSINIVLLDLMMDGLDGFEILERRKDMDFFRKIPVVVITGSEHMEDQVRAFNLGANEYIAKPFVPEIVLSRVDNVMASERRMRAFERKAEKMKIKSELDGMTGLCNKSTCEYQMDQMLKKSERRLDAMLVIDIDNFKTVNDTSGHQAGDHVIKIIANLISGLFRKTDLVGRIGGDEFCVLMVGVPNMDIVRAKANELIQTMRYKPNLAIPEYVTLSIGIVSNEWKNTSYGNLFQKADHALYEAKQEGKAQYQEYGVKPVCTENDSRPVALLISNNRNVCSCIHAWMPNYVRLVEILKVDELEQQDEEIKKKTGLIYADVSDMEQEEMLHFWEVVKQTEWIELKDTFAICCEGNIPQYLASLKSGVSDMFTTPVDHETFRRRTMRQLEKLGIKEES